ncbi:hypothetical protein ACJX0J_037638, partial [Zea mays]
QLSYFGNKCYFHFLAMQKRSLAHYPSLEDQLFLIWVGGGGTVFIVLVLKRRLFLIFFLWHHIMLP